MVGRGPEWRHAGAPGDLGQAQLAVPWPETVQQAKGATDHRTRGTGGSTSPGHGLIVPSMTPWQADRRDSASDLSVTVEDGVVESTPKQSCLSLSFKVPVRCGHPG